MGHRQSKSAQTIQSNTEEMRSVTALSQIPTLRQLYANGSLRRPVNTRFQANDALLDRVALM
jgi:hypothetical protein